jgi:hypothetical protein
MPTAGNSDNKISRVYDRLETCVNCDMSKGFRRRYKSDTVQIINAFAVLDALFIVHQTWFELKLVFLLSFVVSVRVSKFLTT